MSEQKRKPENSLDKPFSSFLGLAEDKGFEVTRIGCCFISQHGSFRYFMPFSMYFSTHSNTSFLFVKEHEKEHRKPYQAQVV